MEVLNQILADVDFFLSCQHGQFSAGGSCQNSYRTSPQGVGLCRRCHQQGLITHEHSGTCENLVTLGSELRCADRCNPSTCATSERVWRIETDVPVGRSKRWVGVAHTGHWFAQRSWVCTDHLAAGAGLPERKRWKTRHGQAPCWGFVNFRAQRWSAARHRTCFMITTKKDDKPLLCSTAAIKQRAAHASTRYTQLFFIQKNDLPQDVFGSIMRRPFVLVH